MEPRRDIEPLLIAGTKDEQRNHQTKKNKIIIIVILILMIGVTFIVTAYMTDFWPFKGSSLHRAGISGKYPVWGGNIKNQQVALNSQITIDNIHNLNTLCIYNSTENGRSLTGYITVDDNNNGYFGDASGFVTSFNLDSCQTIWSVYLSEILNISDGRQCNVRNTISLYKTSNGKKGALFGTSTSSSNHPHGHCYAVSLDISDGTLLWKTQISDNKYSSYCNIHGFMIDNEFAFGGMSSSLDSFQPNIDTLFIGRMSKININNGKLIDQWYSFPIYNETFIDYESEGFYTGNAIWPISAIIDNYVVFGTGNMYSFPLRVQQCMLGNITSIPIENVCEYNLCPQIKDNINNYLNWRCFEKNVYTDSFVILNKHSFKLETAPIPFSGVDAWNEYCLALYFIDKSLFYANKYCPKRQSPIELESTPYNLTSIGPDADPVAIGTYHFNNKLYAAIGQKSGQFYVVEIPNGNVKIIKKVGPGAPMGGSAPFNMAIDEKNMIAIYSILGPNQIDVRSNQLGHNLYPKYYEIMGDGTKICDSGSIHAIDLKTGYTQWQWINPYGKRGDACNDEMYDGYFDPYIAGTCERAFNGTEMLPANETVINVVIPPIDDVIIPLDVENRGDIPGPVTINNGMVFITTLLGDIFVHNITTGQYIHRFQCIDYKINQTKNEWNRAGIRSGVTIFEDRMVFYCGAGYSGTGDYTIGNKIISMKLL